MNVSLNPRLEEFIAEQLKNGRYSNASEIVREGLRLLEEREMKLMELRKDLQTGLESGTPTALDMNEIKEEARRRTEEQGHQLNN